MSYKACPGCGAVCLPRCSVCQKCGTALGEPPICTDPAPPKDAAPDALDAERRAVGRFLRRAGLIVYALGAIAGLLLGRDLDGAFSLSIAAIYWGALFCGGTVLVLLCPLAHLLMALHARLMARK